MVKVTNVKILMTRLKKCMMWRQLDKLLHRCCVITEESCWLYLVSKAFLDVNVLTVGHCLPVLPHIVDKDTTNGRHAW